MRRIQNTLLAILCLVGALSAVNGYGAEPTANNCQIRIVQTGANGKKEKIQFGTHLNSRAECRALAHMHEQVAPPPSVVNKKVGFKWRTAGKRLAMR